jgi:hypothetical protein
VAVGTLKGHDDNLAEKGNPCKKKTSNALLMAVHA